MIIKIKKVYITIKNKMNNKNMNININKKINSSFPNKINKKN